MEGDVTAPPIGNKEANFNPLPPHGGRRDFIVFSEHRDNISIHSLRMEGDAVRAFGDALPDHFNPLPPHGGRPNLLTQSHSWNNNFNPLPPHGGRRIVLFWIAVLWQFQSTPSAWRETTALQTPPGWMLHFNPLPPHGGRRSYLVTICREFQISIHSLRMEGDHSY